MKNLSSKKTSPSKKNKKKSSRRKLLMKIDRTTNNVTFDDVSHLLSFAKIEIKFISAFFGSYLELNETDQKLLLKYFGRCFPTLDMAINFRELEL